METGIVKDWTPGLEEKFNHWLGQSFSFAQKHVVMMIRDAVKYDGRSKQGKRAVLQGRLRVAIASDDDLEEIATLLAPIEALSTGTEERAARELILTRLKKTREEIRERGIEGSDLEC